MPNDFLEMILDHKRALINAKRDYYAEVRKSATPCARPHLLREALSAPGGIKLIAEIKKASPSKNVIREDFDPVAIARIYEANGAAAVSVLTENRYFLGKPEFIGQVRAAVRLPILVKDFIIDEGQIYEASAKGGSAVLLIAAILNDTKLSSLIKTADAQGIDPLVEVHDEEELVRACKAGAGIIGINNRDLRTFVVDTRTCLHLIPKVPEGKLIVGESGYGSHQELKALEKAGAHGVLIGETFMKAEDIAQKMKEVYYGQG